MIVLRLVLFLIMSHTHTHTHIINIILKSFSDVFLRSYYFSMLEKNIYVCLCVCILFIYIYIWKKHHKHFKIKNFYVKNENILLLFTP